MPESDVVRLPVDASDWTPEDIRAAVDVISKLKARVRDLESGRADIAEQFWRDVFVGAIPIMAGQGVAEYADRCKDAYLKRFGVWDAALVDTEAAAGETS